MSFGRIYVVTNTVNGKQYVGQTITKHSRHGHGHAVRRAYKKYGFNKFEYLSIIEGELDQRTLDLFEKFWIKIFDSMVPNGYNLESGGRRGKIVYHSPNKGKQASIETKKKMSESQRKYWNSLETHPNLGKKASKETREKCLRQGLEENNLMLKEQCVARLLKSGISHERKY